MNEFEKIVDAIRKGARLVLAYGTEGSSWTLEPGGYPVSPDDAAAAIDELALTGGDDALFPHARPQTWSLRLAHTPPPFFRRRVRSPVVVGRR